MGNNPNNITTINEHEPGGLDNLDDDERVEDEDGEVGNEFGQDEFAPDEVDGHVERVLPHLRANDDRVVRLRVYDGRDLEELGDVEGDGEEDRCRNQPFDEEVNILKRLSQCFQGYLSN